MKGKTFSFVLIGLVLSACASSTSSVPSSSSPISSSSSTITSVSTSSSPFQEWNQVMYGSEERQVMEIARLSNQTNESPAVLFIHGGSWIGGDKALMRRYRSLVIDQGYVFVSMNYRLLSSGANYLDMLADIRLALTYIQQNGDRYLIDSTHIALVGESAGAHLAMLYAYRNPSPIPIAFVMGLVPPVNFTDPEFVRFGNESFQLFLANSLMSTSVTDPEALLSGYPPAWIDASPFHHLDTAIPTLIGYAGMDELIPLSNMVGLIEQANLINAPIETIFFPNSSHALDKDPSILLALLARFQEYLSLYLPHST